jgi:hypothetical protein
MLEIIEYFRFYLTPLGGKRDNMEMALHFGLHGMERFLGTGSSYWCSSDLLSACLIR